VTLLATEGTGGSGTGGGDNSAAATTATTTASTQPRAAINFSTQSIYLPDTQGCLALADSLINDDVPWMSGPDYISVRAGCRLVHPHISSRVATTLGVKSLRLSLLSKSLDQNIFALPAEASVESFGQAESLTNRLKTILDMYPDGNPIFSELIQNADDAGATVVSILVDENTYNKESLLDSKMAALQGPSLIVRNDATFTEADFKSLAKIGQGSKLDKLATTGRFGLGFNSTYHLTDTPSFVSGDHVVIFDPHCNYVPGASINQPGVRIKYTGSTLSTTFKDQFAPFSFFGCDLKTKYSGTLFRFPLRTPSQARHSEISGRSYSVADVDANVQQLVGNLSNMLIFLRNVRTIEVYRCKEATTVPVLLHRAVAKVYDVETVNDQFLLKFFDKNDGVNSASGLSRDGFYKRLLSTPDNSLPKVFSKIHIKTTAYDPNAATKGSPGNAAAHSGRVVVPRTPDSDDDSSSDGEKHASSSAVATTGTASRSSPSSAAALSAPLVVLGQIDVEYIISAGLCGGTAKRMACQENLRHFKLVPMGAVAACIRRVDSSNSSSGSGDSGGNSSAMVPSTSTSAVASPPGESPSKNYCSTCVCCLQKRSAVPLPSLQGLAFCFLPLPLHTQMPVHSNAYFELSSDRRNIWKGDDTKGEAKMRSGTVRNTP
jgi:hypothetical protein